MGAGKLLQINSFYPGMLNQSLLTRNLSELSSLKIYKKFVRVLSVGRENLACGI